MLVTAIWIAIVQTLRAQDHYNVWFRGTLSIPAGEKLKIDNEFQHRRQNGWENENRFDDNLMFAYGNWIHYQHGKDVMFSLSPFAYFNNYKIIQSQLDKATPSNSEVRFSAAVELQHQIIKKFYLVDRSALEYRIFDNNQADITRFRNRFGFRYDLLEN